jgi:hypothetical protein
MKTGRSIAAVLVGFVVVVVLSIGTDMALRASGIYPTLGQRMADAMFLLALACLSHRPRGCWATTLQRGWRLSVRCCTLCWLE